MEEREGFQLIPAVDVVGTEAVRLRQGEFDNVVAHGGDPVELVDRKSTRLNSSHRL